MSFLRALLDAIFPPRGTILTISKSTIESLGEHVSPTTFEATGGPITFLLPYRTPLVRALILEAKFHETSRAFTVLGSVLAEYLVALEEELPFDSTSFVLIPVPLSKKRFRDRGYNQVERVLREARKILPSHYGVDTHLARRIRDTRAQTSLGRSARLRNMDGAFSVTGPIDSLTTYVVIDDVATTGATISAAATALQGAGAKNIFLVVLAH